MTNPEFAGRGLSFPLRAGPLGLSESVGRQKVDESIRVILGTQYGQRVMRPRFGCNLGSLAFAPNNTTTANLARYYVQEGLTRWEPRIELIDVTVTNNHAAGRLEIAITYRLRVTQGIHEVLYPLDLQRPS